MSNLYIDLNEKHQTLKIRERFFTFLGVALCILGVFPVFFDKVTLGQVVSSSLNFIMGLVMIIQSNLHIFKWTRCYIDISDQTIQYKFWGIQSRTIIHWELVKSMTIGFNEITIDLGNDRYKILNLSFIADSTNQKIKQMLLEIGKEKGIEMLEKDA